MKPEPLKNKLKEDNTNGCVGMSKNDIESYNYVENYFFKEDVKSAVEWLKKELEKLWLDKKIENMNINLINKAFEDVTKKDNQKQEE